MVTLTSTASAATSTLISAAGNSNIVPQPRYVRIVNTDANAVCIAIGSTPTTALYSVRLAQNEAWESPVPVAGDINGIWETDGAGVALVTEF